MVGHFGVEGSLDEGLGQLFEKAFLADEVFRLLVIRQEGVDQVDGKIKIILNAINVLILIKDGSLS